MRSIVFSVLVSGMVGLVGVAKADIISVTYGAAGVQTASSTVIANASFIGTENFSTRNSGGLTTDYGTGGVITGVYSTGAAIAGADQYGGAGGSGSYINAIGGTNGYTISLATNGAPGVNYFGYWLSALDQGNQINFSRDGVVVGTYEPADLVATLGVCSTSNPYCGNPNLAFAGQDAGEPFAFVNFVDTNGFFDQIGVSESLSAANYESDNHTVAYCSNASACIAGTSINVPEPVSLVLLVTGLFALGTVRYRVRRD